MSHEIYSGLEKDWFRKKSPAAIIAKVAEITLATISTWTQEYLDYVGFTNNPIIDILYSMTSAGVWIARTNTLGQLKDANSDAIQERVEYIRRYAQLDISATIGTPSGSPSEAVAQYYHRRIGMLAITLDGSGEYSATAFVTGPEGYYPVVDEYGPAISDFTDAATTLAFSSTGGALVGPTSIDLNLTANVPNTQLVGIRHWNLTDASTINLAITGGGAGGHLWIPFIYHYET